MSENDFTEETGLSGEDLLRDGIDRKIMNYCQGGFPLEPRPFARWGEELGINEAELISRIRRLENEGAISRFGPVINHRARGGDSTLAAMKVPENRFSQVADIVNGFSQVSHNYRRDHELNMWFVISAAEKEEIEETLTDIEEKTGLEIYNMPTLKEYYIGVEFSF
ncbi:MAG: Lrp/AsnC family transcriptional regulator [Candidatus Bipolaricaulota bacterium]|nr:Lrp/AsnC family transcriptional regulator [Candidatus Bipolaricaulota bacterium]